MNADPAAQIRLLDVQSVDTALNQLAHRRDHLPEIQKITEIDEELATHRADAVRAETEVSDLDREQKRIDRDVEQVRARAERDQGRLQSGAGSAKELENLQHEVASLQRRQSTLEDQELEIMERREEAEGRLTEVAAKVDELTAARAELEGTRDEALKEIEAQIAERQSERAEIVGDIPADLLALYDKIRAQSGGVGAAMLSQRRCEGCRIELAGGELETVRKAAPDTVVRCEECRRILVRTKNSGL
ncbi:MAG TPA: C4-type zinc ribbon domain-containing protein [Mycobacteriales bacterium]|nr:C4-type zinc ribbon domain-containing protein [Mycobacteriales bacterium]